MSLRFVFWFLMLLWLLFSGWIGWTAWGTPGGPGGHVVYYTWGGNLLAFALFGLLGWRVFGPPVQG